MMIDQKVLAGFQWLVDESERQPAWWAEHTAWAGTAFGIVAYILAWNGEIELFWLGILFMAGGLMVYLCRVPLFFSMFGSRGYVRAIFWVSLATRVAAFIAGPANWRAAYIANDALLLAFAYFAACQPPRPRRRRQAVAQRGAA